MKGDDSMDDIHKRFAANLQKFRKKKDLTQEELAQKLGVTFQAISKWENAKAAPDIFLLPTIADIFCCTVDQLFYGDVQGEMRPIRVDKITVGQYTFDASYFGAIDMSSWSVYATKREFWRLEDTGNIFENCARTNQVLPYNNYPLYFDATNEKGVSVAALNFPGFAKYTPKKYDKDNIASFEFR